MTATPQRSLMRGERCGAAYLLRLPDDTGGLVAGLRRGGRAGRSVDFRDYRTYQPGDDLRWIDWNVYARTDDLTVKLYHEEVSPHLDLVLDGSLSMVLEDTAKADAHLGVAAALATAAATASCSVAVWLVSERTRRLENSGGRPSEWLGLQCNGRRSPADVLLADPPRLRPNSIRILLSDLMWPEDPVPVVRRLAERAAAVHVVQILADQERQPPQHGNLRLHDIETDQRLELFVDDGTRQRYMDALAAHSVEWRAACRSYGATFASLTAEDIVRDWDLTVLVESGVLQGA